ncbi:transcription factor VIP1-like [Zingiber officinale]|uniref:transcription factor VIP1-like n=1 Tax=Zingiber officinale TaxID=94328 RepID=UPI001C4BCAF0|nr:transcription factor VIP1-like [Zingiber officinale]
MESASLQPPTHPRFGEIPLPNHPRGGGGGGGGFHRRAHSETFISLHDGLLLDSEPDFEIPDIDFSSFSDDTVSADSGAPLAARPDPPAATEARQRQVPGVHFRSLSVDTSFFEGMSFQEPASGGIGAPGSEKRGHHRRSGSMDGATSAFQGESALPFPDFAKKAMPSDKLAELALIDPKRAKRILANRRSAARSKERKIHYTTELEQKIQALQIDATTLSAQLTHFQRDSTSLTAENRELKLRLQAMEQQSKLREALNEALREEVQRLKNQIGEVPNANGNHFRTNSLRSMANYPAHREELPRQNTHLSQHIYSSQAAQVPSNGQQLSDQSLIDLVDLM